MEPSVNNDSKGQIIEKILALGSTYKKGPLQAMKRDDLLALLQGLQSTPEPPWEPTYRDTLVLFLLDFLSQKIIKLPMVIHTFSDYKKSNLKSFYSHVNLPWIRRVQKDFPNEMLIETLSNPNCLHNLYWLLLQLQKYDSSLTNCLDSFLLYLEKFNAEFPEDKVFNLEFINSFKKVATQ
jgi:hypothetical protein